ISALLLPNFWAYYSSFSLSTLRPVFLFGAVVGIGIINSGITQRLLGLSMGLGIAFGINVDSVNFVDATDDGQFLYLSSFLYFLLLPLLFVILLFFFFFFF
ncbi:L-rhamnose/proton symporter RhaT, partial [Escherichia coli]|uniref:L-rhamnose/proton symporter RhaT n=1 Tax=Escherichia coli TaxID=562 RepID=UPI001BDB83AC